MTAPTAPTQGRAAGGTAAQTAHAAARAAPPAAARPAPGSRAPTAGRRWRSPCGQRQLWFLHQLDPDSPEYLLPLAHRLRGTLDESALRRSFDALAARHEILRTRYVLDGGEPRQVIDPAGPVDYAVSEVTGAPEAGRDAAAAAFARARATEVFDLATEAPLRVRLLRLAADDHVLVVVMHHIACDALTRPLLLADLAACYRAAGAITGPLDGVLPEPPVQYADYAAWLGARQSGPAADAALDWWRGQLAGTEPLGLPTDRPRPSVRGWEGAVAEFDVPAAVAARLRTLAEQEGATLFMVLLSAYQALLGRYTGKQDVAVGTAVSGRTRPELQQMAYYAYNSLVLRGRWQGDPAFRELLAANRTTVLDAFDHQDTPFDKIADELEPERDLSTTPLFQVMFDLASGHGSDSPDLPGLEVAPVAASGRIARFDLTVHLAERPDGSLHGALEYATDLFEAATAERITGHYAALLAAVAERPGAPCPPSASSAPPSAPCCSTAPPNRSAPRWKRPPCAPSSRPSPSRSPPPPTRSPSGTSPATSRTPTSTPAPTGSRAACSSWAYAPTRRSACSWTAAPTSSPHSSASGAPRPPTCRSTRATPTSASPSCSATPPPVW